MRRFIEEIRVQDPDIARKIIEALEAKPEDDSYSRCTVWPRNIYEVDVYEHYRDPGPMRNKPDEHGYVLLKIFVREDVK